MSRRGAEVAVWLCHALLLVSATGGLAAAPLAPAARAGLVAVAAAPLLAAIPGLYRGRRHTQQWLALALVAYAGAAAAEVVASLGRSPWASLALLAALVELALLLALSRPRTAPRRETPE